MTAPKVLMVDVDGVVVVPRPGGWAADLERDLGLSVAALQASFRGKGWVTVEKLEEFVASGQTDFHTGHLREHGLVPLERAGQLEVDSRRTRTLVYPKGKTRVRFR